MCAKIVRDSIGLMLRRSPCPQGEVSVSKHRKSVYPTCAHLMPISGKPEIGCRPHPLETGARKSDHPPQDEAGAAHANVSCLAGQLLLRPAAEVERVGVAAIDVAGIIGRDG